MKLTYRMDKLEDELVSHDSQIATLRREIARLTSLIGEKGAPDTTKNDHVEFGQKVSTLLLDTIKQHPLVEGRDLYPLSKLYTLIISFMEPEEHGLPDVDAESFRPRTNAVMRSLSIRLVGSGLFTRRKTQRYVPADFELGLKPSRRRHTCIIANNHSKYENMSETQIDKLMVQQDTRAQVLYDTKLRDLRAKEAKAKTTELDSDVSFL